MCLVVKCFKMMIICQTLLFIAVLIRTFNKQMCLWVSREEYKIQSFVNFLKLQDLFFFLISKKEHPNGTSVLQHIFWELLMQAGRISKGQKAGVCRLCSSVR